MKDNEFGRLYDMLVPLYEAGLDAVLIQDLGVMDFVRRHFPDLPIHTSTQMNILTPEGARFAKANGASRVVAAREMTLEELKIIKQEGSWYKVKVGDVIGYVYNWFVKVGTITVED